MTEESRKSLQKTVKISTKHKENLKEELKL